MKFVDELPRKNRRWSRYDRMVGADNMEAMRRNPGRWALVAEKYPKADQNGFHAWGTRNGFETATRMNLEDPDTIDFYARYQPQGSAS